MFEWLHKKKAVPAAVDAAEVVRRKYSSFRELLTLNTECLELMAGLQEDLQFVEPLLGVVGDRVRGIFERAEGIVSALGRLTGSHQATLAEAVAEQRRTVERYIAGRQERPLAALAVSLRDVDMAAVAQAGGKAAALGEIRNRMGLAVPDGFVLTTDAYRQFCGMPLWKAIRDGLRDLDLDDLERLRQVSARLMEMVEACPIPRAVEVAITERARKLETRGGGFAVRSSAVGEGGERTFAGQFESLINVPLADVAAAYKRVIAARFSERAIFYRVSTGLAEVASPMAILFLPVIRARAAGILYTRVPGDHRSRNLWITSARGLAIDVASGRMPADLFVVERHRPHAVVERNIVRKQEEIAPEASGGLTRRSIDSNQPSLSDAELRQLAEWGVALEEHFHGPQDVEWAIDAAGKPWILQSRPLALGEAAQSRLKSRTKTEALVSGGRTVYPGRTSGPAYLADGPAALSETPRGALLCLRRVTPEIIPVFPRISGLVSETGNVTGHAAALLREFRIPSAFGMGGLFDRLRNGDPLSLDAVPPAVYAGTLWPPRKAEAAPAGNRRDGHADPISSHLLKLDLLDPSAHNFRPSGCRSTHDVLRFCHEKAIEAMFLVNDIELERGPHCSKKLVAPVPLNLYVLDLGDGMALRDPAKREVTPEEIVSRPFRSLWQGVSHPGVSWRREMPARLSDLASVVAATMYSDSATRALGDKSYLLVAREYMNLNSRLAYHFSLVDACLSDTPQHNYISFRFAGGGAAKYRRNLRACFVEACLTHHEFQVDRRGDLVNAWYRRAPAEATAKKLDILGRLLACTSQLDMYMVNDEVMRWYVRQFLEGNYSFEATAEKS